MDGETHKSRQRLPFFRPRGATNLVPEGQTGSSLGSVGAYWPPLTPEHGFPSLLYAARAQGAPPLPAPGQAGAPMCLLTLPSERIKKRGARWAPRLVTASMTPYGGMTHIR